MSTIKSSAENLTLNADGANNDIKFQSNGVEKASIDQDGKVTAGGASLDGAVTINDTGADVDFRVESDGLTHALFVEGGNGRIGVNTDSPAYSLHMVGDRLMTENLSNGTTGIFMRVKNSGTQVANSTFRLDNNGDVTIYQGTTSEAVKLKFLVGGGIAFNGDTAAANALDDYEEGTWTPTAVGGLSGLTKTDCFYTKIGNIVHLAGRVSGFTGIDSSTLQFGGLPFNPTHSSSSGTVSTTFVDLDQGYQLWMYLAHDEPKIYLRYQMNNAQYNSLAGSDISSSSNIYFNATYIVD